MNENLIVRIDSPNVIDENQSEEEKKQNASSDMSCGQKKSTSISDYNRSNYYDLHSSAQ